jgi:hypothetical protein
MGPFGLVAFALGAAVGGIIGNRADDTFCRVMNMVIERLRRAEGPSTTTCSERCGKPIFRRRWRCARRC